MQDTYYQEIDQIFLIMKETFYGLILAPKKYHLHMFLKINVVIQESHILQKKVHFVDALSRRTYF